MFTAGQSPDSHLAFQQLQAAYKVDWHKAAVTYSDITNRMSADSRHYPVTQVGGRNQRQQVRQQSASVHFLSLSLSLRPGQQLKVLSTTSTPGAGSPLQLVRSKKALNSCRHGFPGASGPYYT